MEAFYLAPRLQQADSQREPIEDESHLHLTPATARMATSTLRMWLCGLSEKSIEKCLLIQIPPPMPKYDTCTIFTKLLSLHAQCEMPAPCSSLDHVGYCTNGNSSPERSRCLHSPSHACARARGVRTCCRGGTGSTARYAAQAARCLRGRRIQATRNRQNRALRTSRRRSRHAAQTRDDRRRITCSR